MQSTGQVFVIFSVWCCVPFGIFEVSNRLVDVLRLEKKKFIFFAAASWSSNLSGDILGFDDVQIVFPVYPAFWDFG
ncbi:hypothetical protein RhiirA5_362289 [Rhizophagus irregularis]|uniref:Uncharacterized protein n=2 Tax=Rhizophagus irregularis TaxID=588596 RepID=A0A2N0PCE9_9GLOM|nr:hypothetical protein RhiirA5_362289 [Rhizophagus irregularis]GET66160.1 hypothetical protein RIR_e24419_A0A2N0PCE9_9GLOM [Rhizophagus irregularis DAOM 181602=DAOM 197198]